MTEPQFFEFGVSSLGTDKTPNRFWHPVECINGKDRRFGVQNYRRIQNHFIAELSTGVADLHTVAVACYFADKHYRRDETADRWTRRFHMSIPVIDPEPWERGAGALFTSMLELLTSDRWQLEFRQDSMSAVHLRQPMDGVEPGSVEAVSLFSGGLDSFCHNVIEAETNPRPRLLVAHGVPAQLSDIQDSLSRRIPGAACTLVQYRVEPRRIMEWSRRQLELSQRSRTLLFMSTALLACDSRGVPVLEVPENGLLALNPPLNATRVGALSTRSVHPSVLRLLNRILDHLGLDLRVENPVAHLTKGELCRRAADLLGSEGLSALAETVSCSSMMPGRTRNPHQAPNCGGCYPCLIRRASLEAAGGDLTGYDEDRASRRAREAQSNTRRVLRQWLTRPFGMPELLASGPLPPETDVDAVLDVVRRSRAELSECFAPE